MTEPPHHQDAEDVKTPLSFKLRVALAALYLGWRLVQGVVWLINQIG